jgi:macrolide transport system ATP-binding/permease protein
MGVMNVAPQHTTTRACGGRILGLGPEVRAIPQQFGMQSGLGARLVSDATAIDLSTVALVAAVAIPLGYALALVAIAFTCAVATGLVFGFAPVMKADRLDPVVALASE